MMSLSISCNFSLFRFPFNSISRRSSTPEDFNKTRSSVFSCIEWTWSDCSLFHLFLTLASFRISILVIFILGNVIILRLKCLSALSACFIGVPIRVRNLFFFFLSVKSVLIRIFWLNLLRLSIVFSSDLFLRQKNSLFNRLWSFFIFEFIWSLAHDIDRGSRIWRNWLKMWFLGSLGAAALEVTVANCSSIG